MMLLKLRFAHWLNAASRDRILKFHKSMTRRSTALGCEGLDSSFYSNGSVVARICIETHFFNQLVFHVLDNLLPGVLNNHRLFRDNLNFYVDSEGHNLS